MEKDSSCILLTVGNKGVGKLDLVRRVTYFAGSHLKDKLTSTTRGDWIIYHNGAPIYVEIKVSSDIRKSMSIYESLRRNDNVILNIVLNISNEEYHFEEIRWLEYLKKLKLFPKLTIIATLNESGPINPKMLNSLRASFPFVNYWLSVPIHFENESIESYTRYFRQIIVNKLTENLRYVKALVFENLNSKDKILDIGNCSLTSLDELPQLFECVHLETLVISNEWGQFKEGNWQREESNNKIGRNILYHLPKEISKLKNLKILICGGDWKSKRKRNITRWNISDITELATLKNLTTLNISNNNLSSFDGLEKLTKLRKLHLNNNRLTHLPSLAKHVALEELNLSNNMIRQLDFLKNLKSVKTIDLHSNEIRDLSPIRDLVSKLNIKLSKWDVNTICVFNNPLETPKISVIEGGKKAVAAYFKIMDAENKIQLPPFKNRDIKLVLVGNSNVGKSTLLKWLTTNIADNNIPTTHWMEIGHWNIKSKNEDFVVRIFDFGGQEYYHDTHHLFFTNRTAYLILWEEKTNQFAEVHVDQTQQDGSKSPVLIRTFPLEYWLDSISFYINRRKYNAENLSIRKLIDERDDLIEQVSTPKSENKLTENTITETDSPINNDTAILIVQNKVDDHLQKRFLNENNIKHTYQQIYDFGCLSVTAEKGGNELKEKLINIFRNLNIVNQNYLGTWGFIKKKIESKKFQKAYTLSEFKNFCNKAIREIPDLISKRKQQINSLIFNSEDAHIFAEFLADIGLALYYPEDPNLKDKVFLNQAKILSGIYSVLHNVNPEEGEFDKKSVAKLLSNSALQQNTSELINLMIRFKIISEHPVKTDWYIAPLYLPKEPRKYIELFLSIFDNSLCRYEFGNFMPKGLILDFFQHYSKKVFVENEINNLYYYWRDGLVLKEQNSNEIVLVRFWHRNNSENSARIDVSPMKGVRSGKLLDDIVNHLDAMSSEFRATKCVTANGVEFVPLSEIKKNEKNDNWIFFWHNKYFKLADFKQYLDTSKKMKKVFISYSKHDLHYVTKFLEHLSSLHLDGKISHWFCSELEAGERWDQKIKDQFYSSDIVCFMISSNFMKTKYIHEQEIELAFRRKNSEDNFKIIPIILDFCKWSTLKNNLADFTALPYTAKPVADFSNQNMAWYIIQESLRTIIENDIENKGEDFYTNVTLPSDVLKIYQRIISDRIDNNPH